MSQVDRIPCLICGRLYQKIHTVHLRQHGITFSEYRRRFPSAPTVSESCRQRVADSVRGHVVSAASRAKISAANRGRKLTDLTKARIGAASSRMIRTPEHSANVSAALQGHFVSDETREKIRKANTGYVHTEETRAKLSAVGLARFKANPAPTGPDHWCWRGGDCDYGVGFTASLKETVRWLYHHRCATCGQSSRGKRDLHVHHIDYNKKNHSVANLIPLCGSCHMKTNTN